MDEYEGFFDELNQQTVEDRGLITEGNVIFSSMRPVSQNMNEDTMEALGNGRHFFDYLHEYVYEGDNKKVDQLCARSFYVQITWAQLVDFGLDNYHMISEELPKEDLYLPVRTCAVVLPSSYYPKTQIYTGPTLDKNCLFATFQLQYILLSRLNISGLRLIELAVLRTFIINCGFWGAGREEGNDQPEFEYLRFMFTHRQISRFFKQAMRKNNISNSFLIYREVRHAWDLIPTYFEPLMNAAWYTMHRHPGMSPQKVLGMGLPKRQNQEYGTLPLMSSLNDIIIHVLYTLNHHAFSQLTVRIQSTLKAGKSIRWYWDYDSSDNNVE